MNHQEVVEEDRRKKLPKNFDAKRARIEWEETEEAKRKVTTKEIFILISLLDVLLILLSFSSM